MRRVLRTLLFVVALAGLASLTAPARAATTLFADEFNDTLVDGRWTKLNRPGDASNHELQCYRPGNVVESGGALRIRTARDLSCSGGYTSGMVQWSSFRFTYGTVTIRALEAGGKGPWPAQWLLGADCQQTNKTTADNAYPCSWPRPGSDEIDMTEILGSVHNVVHQGVHMSSGSPACNASTSATNVNWHVYTLDWRPGRITWKIDGRVTCSITSNVPYKPMFLILNTAVGGAGGAVDASTLPQVTQIDYVRVTS